MMRRPVFKGGTGVGEFNQSSTNWEPSQGAPTLGIDGRSVN